MNPYFLMVLVLAALVVWTSGSFFFWRISRAHKANLIRKDSQPAYRLAEQWLAESQRKLEELYKKSEQPLGTAQNELLELRLEAGRLPQGVKGLRSVRESLAGDYKPLDMKKGSSELVRLYLDGADYRNGEGSLVFLKTPLGEMPCLEAGKPGSPLGEEDMKAALGSLSRGLEPKSSNRWRGGFLLFSRRHCQYQAVAFKNPNGRRAEGPPAHGHGFPRVLTALLLSLRMARDSEKVLGAFEQGVEATKFYWANRRK